MLTFASRKYKERMVLQTIMFQLTSHPNWQASPHDAEGPAKPLEQMK